ncbi:UDP-N-acetylmuramate dehydrogenase, partial [Desulfovibrio piger]
EGPEIVWESEARAHVRAGAGVPLPRLLGFCARRGLGGLEGLVGIPGSVGGAVAMNAGSYGCETCRNLLEIKAVVDGRPRVFPAAELQYGYRTLLVDGKKNGFLVLEATFDLTKTDRDGSSKLMHRNICEKKSKQPVTAWSAGCVFKNPAPDKPAGILLDRAGFRGRRLGGMAFSTMHANFLINEGNGSASAAFELIESARQGVLEQFGITLETEVRIVP